jgi:hypothetical protein
VSCSAKREPSARGEEEGNGWIRLWFEATGREGARGALSRAGRRFNGGKERDGAWVVLDCSLPWLASSCFFHKANGTDLVVVSTVLVGGLSPPVGNRRRWVLFPWAFFAFDTVDMRRKMAPSSSRTKGGRCGNRGATVEWSNCLLFLFFVLNFKKNC